jgi:hypothetical protein
VVGAAAGAGLGLIDRREHWTMMRATIEDVVIPRFRDRGLLEAGVDGDALAGELVRRDGKPVPPWMLPG